MKRVREIILPKETFTEMKYWRMFQAKRTQEKRKWRRHVTRETVVRNKTTRSGFGAVTAANVPMFLM